ncbi:MAG: 3-oxoacyl-[acyl-carrier-protein] synthase [Candidatus Solibacter sp.]|jgi:3-oxoacyl-[acyl-carrier-protein] synthase II|nr:3-oxoacyl-[acyl-carrier-protein] synthase [Candidatus Solibacter sp.]
MTSERRVVVTGVGLISPVGIGTENTWKAITAGVPGIATITQFDPTEYDCKIAGEVKGFDPTNWIERKDVKKLGRFAQFAVAATHMALADSGLKIDDANAERVGVLIGAGIGGFEVIEREYRTLLEKGPSRVSPFFIPATIINLAAGQVSIRTGAKGPNSAVATACTTGAHAIGDAFKIIQRCAADAMICGGVEAAITPLSVAGFCAMRAMSTRNDAPAAASRPFDRARDGFVIGEGGGILILEELEFALRRGAPILAEIVGYGMSSDAYHLSAPLENGDGILRVMRNALADAGLLPEQIDYLNAHATSTPLGDRGEARAMMTLFADTSRRVAVSSTKSMTGHLLGGSGSLEAGLSVLAIRDQLAPPTINLEDPDPEIWLDLLPNHSRPLPIACAMSNSFGFGGTNGCLIFRRYPTYTAA